MLSPRAIRVNSDLELVTVKLLVVKPRGASFPFPLNEPWRSFAEPLATTGVSGSALEETWFVTALYLPLSKLLVSRADSHGSSVGPVNHVLRAIRGHIPPRVTRDRTPTNLRSHIASDSCPKDAPNLANVRARARLSKCFLRIAIHDRHLRSPNIAEWLRSWKINVPPAGSFLPPFQIDLMSARDDERLVDARLSQPMTIHLEAFAKIHRLRL